MERTYKKIEIVGIAEASLATPPQNAVEGLSVTTPC